MPKFFYQARKGPKKLEKGTIEAATESQAVVKLTQMGYFPISVASEEEGQKGQGRALGFFRRISRREVTAFIRQLSNLLDSGLTHYRALTILQKQAENKQLQLIIQDLAGQVKEGNSLSQALTAYPAVFGDVYVNMIKAGESSGAIVKVLQRLADFGEMQEDVTAKVRSAMVYPILMATVGIVCVFLLLTFVIPMLIELFEDMGQLLPLPTRMLIVISNFFVNYWWLALAAVLFAIFAVRRNLFTARGKIAFDRFRLRLPVLGKLFKLAQIARFSRTLGTLLANGVPILQAMDSVIRTLDSAVFKQEGERIIKQIRKGSTLSQGIAQSKYFPVLVGNMLAVGEEGGRLEQALLKIAQAYEKQTEQAVKIFTALIEPIMILVIGAVVGFIVIAMLLPIFQISLIAK